jgi:hypothetical protein
MQFSKLRPSLPIEQDPQHTRLQVRYNALLFSIQLH